MASQNSPETRLLTDGRIRAIFVDLQARFSSRASQDPAAAQRAWQVSKALVAAAVA